MEWYNRIYIVLARVFVTFHATDTQAYALLRLSMLRDIWINAYSNFRKVFLDQFLMRETNKQANRKKINKRHRSSTIKWIRGKKITNKQIGYIKWQFASRLDPCSVCYSFGLVFYYSNWLFKDHDLMLKSAISLFRLLAGETNANILEPHTILTEDASNAWTYHMGTHHWNAFRTQTILQYKNEMKSIHLFTLHCIHKHL